MKIRVYVPYIEDVIEVPDTMTKEEIEDEVLSYVSDFTEWTREDET